MTLTINFLAKLRDVMGVSELEIEIPDQVSVHNLLSILVKDFPHISPIIGSTIVVVNQEFAGPDTLLSPKDKIMLLPPVSGG
jgi:molybdopterin converting factor small subunit